MGVPGFGRGDADKWARHVPAFFAQARPLEEARRGEARQARRLGARTRQSGRFPGTRAQRCPCSPRPCPACHGAQAGWLARVTPRAPLGPSPSSAGLGGEGERERDPRFLGCGGPLFGARLRSGDQGDSASPSLPASCIRSRVRDRGVLVGVTPQRSSGRESRTDTPTAGWASRRLRLARPIS